MSSSNCGRDCDYKQAANHTHSNNIQSQYNNQNEALLFRSESKAKQDSKVESTNFGDT